MAIVVAAGAGERLGRGEPKAFVSVGGRSMLSFSLEAMARSGVIDAAVLVAPPGLEGEARSVAHTVRECVRILDVVAGGATRQESVRRGLEIVPDGVGFVLCHDAARPFARPELFRSVVAELLRERSEAVVPVVPSPDTVKRIRGRAVLQTLPREEIGLAQTPQGFRAGALRDAHRKAAARGLERTDDAALVEAAGYRVVTVAGERANFKVTTDDDLARAEQALRELAAGGAWWSG